MSHSRLIFVQLFFEELKTPNSFAKLRQPSGQNFPISFKPKVAIAKFIGKMQRKTWYSSFPQKPVVKEHFQNFPKQ